jgi:dihydroxyacetone kinase-like predicted kinase
VLRDVSTCADACEAEHMEVPECLEALVVEAYESVARTP